jgi:hypothetical protein
MSTERPRKSDTRETLDMMADLPLIFMAVGVLVLMLQIFAMRVPHPYDLEWMEGGMLLHGYRIQTGQPLYVIPSSEFIPFIYTPLYSWILGLGGKIFGLSYTLGRLISVLGSLAAAAAIIAAVRGERGSIAVGMGAAALFLTTWDESGTFMDLVRTDGLLIGLMGWSLVALRHGWIRTGGLLLVLAFMAKHAVAIFGLPALIWIGVRWGWAGVRRFLLWCLIPAVAFVEWMVLEGDGLFLTYILEVPSTHPFVFKRFWPGTPDELYSTLPHINGVLRYVLPLALVALLYRLGVRRGWIRWSPAVTHSWPERVGPGLYWGSQAALVLVMCMAMRGHHGGYLNVLMPGHWMMAAVAGMTLAGVQRWVPSLWVRIAVTTLISTQLWHGTQWTKNGKEAELAAYLPTEGDVLGGDAVVDELASIRGPVLAPWSPWLPAQAGKRPFFHLIAAWDIGHEGSPLSPYLHEITRDMKTQRWSAIVVGSSLRRKSGERSADKAMNRTLRATLVSLEPSRGYRLGTELPREQQIRLRTPIEAGSRPMLTKTGWPVRPQSVWNRKIRSWTVELPPELSSQVDLAAIRQQWQGIWLRVENSGPKEIWVIEGRTLSAYDSSNLIKETLPERFVLDVLSPCAVGKEKKKDGNLPELKIQGFQWLDDGQIGLGEIGQTQKDGWSYHCAETRLEVSASGGAAESCQAWTGRFDHHLAVYTSGQSLTESCTQTESPSSRTRLIPQESFAEARQALLDSASD